MGKTSRIKQYRHSVVKNFLHCNVWFWFSWNQLCISCFSVESTNRPTDEVYPPAKVAGRKPAESLAGLGTNKRRAICQNFQTEIRRRKTLLLLLAETGGRHQHSAFHDYMLRTKHCKMMAIAEENRFAYKWYSITCQCIIFGRFAGVAAVVGINKGSSNHGDW